MGSGPSAAMRVEVYFLQRASGFGDGAPWQGGRRGRSGGTLLRERGGGGGGRMDSFFLPHKIILTGRKKSNEFPVITSELLELNSTRRLSFG